jgi:hypothetical protein
MGACLARTAGASLNSLQVSIDRSGDHTLRLLEQMPTLEHLTLSFDTARPPFLTSTPPLCLPDVKYLAIKWNGQWLNAATKFFFEGRFSSLK